MANLIKGFINQFKLADDEDYDYDDNTEELERAAERNRRKEERVREKQTRTENKFSLRTETPASEPEEEEEAPIPVITRAKRTASPSPRTERREKVVPIRTNNNLGVEIVASRPKVFNEAKDICDNLLAGKAVVVNLEGIDPTEAQRIIDFSTGTLYSVNGKYMSISKYIFIFTPDNIDLTGDIADILTPDNTFDVPVLNKDF